MTLVTRSTKKQKVRIPEWVRTFLFDVLSETSAQNLSLRVYRYYTSKGGDGGIRNLRFQYPMWIIFFGIRLGNYLASASNPKQSPRLFISAFAVLKRRRRDSNPRALLDAGTLAVCWFQPLTHISIARLYYANQGVFSNASCYECQYIQKTYE